MGSRPFERSIVSTVSSPSPENVAGRRTRLHWTSDRVRPPTFAVGSHFETGAVRMTERLRCVAAARASGVSAAGGTNGSACGTCDETTIRALRPTRRAATYAPSNVSFFTTLSAFGFETSTSLTTDCDGIHGTRRAVAAGSGCAQ